MLPAGDAEDQARAGVDSYAMSYFSGADQQLIRAKQLTFANPLTEEPNEEAIGTGAD
jgi:hypothetical protein